jgi:hypothetical protein
VGHEKPVPRGVGGTRWTDGGGCCCCCVAKGEMAEEAGTANRHPPRGWEEGTSVKMSTGTVPDWKLNNLLVVKERLRVIMRDGRLLLQRD